MKRRLQMFRLWLLIGLIWLLAACNQAEPTPTPTATPANNEAAAAEGVAVAGESNVPAAENAPAATPTPVVLSGRVVLWHSWAEADGDALQAILTAFQQANPSVTIDTLFVAYNDLPQSYTDAVLADAGPDLILAASWWLDEMVAANVVQPLDGLVSEAELAAYSPAAIANLQQGGSLYGLPTHVELVTLFYNRALVAPEQVPTTSDALLALAQQSEQQGAGLYASLYHLYWGLPAYGAQLIDADGRVLLDQNTGAEGYLNWLLTLSKTPGSFVDLDYGMLLDRFKKGEFAFFVDGPWAIGELRSALGENLATAPLPAGPAGASRPWLNADGVFLNPHSAAEQQTLALALARFLTSPAAGEILSQTAGRLPANLAATIGGDPLLQGFAQQAASAEPLPTSPEMDAVWGYGGDLLLKILNEVGDPASLIAETTTLINEENGR